MSAVIVLGMHRSGTSMLSQMLQAMGVWMGDNQDELYEDRDFLQLNRDILADADGIWHDIPSPEALAASYERMRPAIVKMLTYKQRRGLWGWKDPRTSLTAALFHPHLDNPRYIVIRRDLPDVVASLEERNGEGDWAGVYEQYRQRIEAFVRTVDAPVFEVRYEDLTHPKAAPAKAKALAAFLGLGDKEAALALDCIEFRDRWGFGSIGFGTPYLRPVYEFFRWWTWLIIDGFEAGDACLQTADLRCEVPIPLAHNALVKEFLKTPCDTLLIIEDDHTGDQQTIRRMRNKLENQGFDIVCASYPNRRGVATQAMGVNFSGAVTEYGEYDCIISPPNTWKTGTQPFDCAALGCVLIRRWVLEAMLGDNDPEEFFWFDWRGRNSQDVTFYARVKELTRARVGVDRDNDVGHVGKKVWTMRDFWQVWDPFIEKQKRADLPWVKRLWHGLRLAKDKFQEVMADGRIQG